MHQNQIEPIGLKKKNLKYLKKNKNICFPVSNPLYFLPLGHL